MLDTAKELHIAIDQGLQSIDSNRKGSIEPAEKDFVLNTVMLQQINSRIDPKSNAKNEGFEDTIKIIDDLESLKVDTTEFADNALFEFSDKAVFMNLPSDYLRMIEGVSRINHFGSAGSSAVPFKAFRDFGIYGEILRPRIGYLKLPSITTGDYSDLRISLQMNVTGSVGSESYDNYDLFNLKEVGNYFSYLTGVGAEQYDLHGINPIESPQGDGKFQLVSLVLDYLNNPNPNSWTGYSDNLSKLGLKFYWERYGHIYMKDHFIVVADGYKLQYYNDNTPPDDIRIYLSPTGNLPNDIVDGDEDTFSYLDNYYRRDGVHLSYEEYAIFEERRLTLTYVNGSAETVGYYTDAEQEAYNNANFKERPVRIVKSNELRRLLRHPYGKTIHDSPIGIISDGKFIVYVDDTFEADRIDMVYYRKPKMISLMNNQGCELTSDSFKMELVEKTIQKLSARIQDPNYRNLLQENITL